MEGLGQVSEIQDIYIEHLKEALEAPVTDAAKQKASAISES